MARQLHDAEQARDAAVLDLETRDADLTARLANAEAQRQAAQDELSETRTEVEELRVYIEQKLARGQIRRLTRARRAPRRVGVAQAPMIPATAVRSQPLRTTSVDQSPRSSRRSSAIPPAA